MDYNFTSVFKVWEGKPNIKDPEIIDWCRDNDHIWVHADDSAKREHLKQMVSAGIRTIWVFRKDGKMTGAQQLRILSYRLDKLGESFRKKPGVKHYKLGVHGQTGYLDTKIEPMYLT